MAQPSRTGASDKTPFDEDPREHARLKRIFLKTVSMEADERKRFLDDACEGEPRLRGEIESLLHFHFQAVEDSNGPDEP